MIVPRKEWEALKEKVEVLERKVNNNNSFVFFKRFDYSRLCFGLENIPHKELTVKEAIQHIQSHLGIHYEYVDETPAKLDLKVTMKVESTKRRP